MMDKMPVMARQQNPKASWIIIICQVNYEPSIQHPVFQMYLLLL